MTKAKKNDGLKVMVQFLLNPADIASFWCFIWLTDSFTERSITFWRLLSISPYERCIRIFSLGHDFASFFFVNDFGPQLTIAYLNLAITDPNEAMTYPTCGSVPHLTVAYPHMTVLQITTLKHNSYGRRTKCKHKVSHYSAIGKVLFCL